MWNLKNDIKIKKDINELIYKTEITQAEKTNLVTKEERRGGIKLGFGD